MFSRTALLKRKSCASTRAALANVPNLLVIFCEPISFCNLTICKLLITATGKYLKYLQEWRLFSICIFIWKPKFPMLRTIYTGGSVGEPKAQLHASEVIRARKLKVQQNVPQGCPVQNARIFKIKKLTTFIIHMISCHKIRKKKNTDGWTSNTRVRVLILGILEITTQMTWNHMLTQVPLALPLSQVVLMYYALLTNTEEAMPIPHQKIKRVWGFQETFLARFEM